MNRTNRIDLFRQYRCLICNEVVSVPVGWVFLFSKEKGERLCLTCLGKLRPIRGELCKICGRTFESSDSQFRRGDLCLDCVRWEGDSEWKDLLAKNTSLFLYNDFLKETIAKFKYRGDYAIAAAFSPKLKEEAKKLSADFYIPIPLSEERLYERGFNQAEALLEAADLSPSKILTRIHSEKQSKKSRSERIHIPQVFQLVNTHDVSGKSFVLVDDIYTTGSTLRHAAKLLKEAGARNVQSFTLARG